MFNRLSRAALRTLALAGGLAAAFAVPDALAQETIAPSTFTRGISVDGGRVYFADGQAEFCTSQRTRSVSVGGGAITDLVTLSGCPLTGVLKADGSYVFSATFHPQIVRHWSGGTSPSTTTLVSPSTFSNSIQTIDAQGDWVYWAGDSALGRVNRDGTSPVQIPRQTTFRPGMAASANGFVYWSEGNEAAGRIMRADLSAPAPVQVAGAALNSPANLAVDATHVYWSETSGVVKRTTLAPGGAVTTLRSAVAGGYNINSLVVDGANVFILESTGSGIGRIFRIPKAAGGGGVQVGPGNLSFAFGMRQDADQLYWIETSNGNIRRMRKDAAAVQPDFSWLGLEVTQAIQNINNDVPIIQGKPTLVRGYARTTISYPNVTARLTGVRTSDGSALPGSPLRSSVATMSPPLDASITDPRRRDINSTFNWEIPDSWLQADVTLTATINFDNSISESSTANNNIVRNIPVNRTSPICLKLRRTDTNAPVYEASGPAFRAALNRFTSLVPARSVRIFPQSGLFQELSCCRWDIPPWYWGEWEAHDDHNKMIVQLCVEATFSVDFAQCILDNAPTHRMALIHPDTYTGSRSGLGNYVYNVGWVRMDGDADGDNITTHHGEPDGGITLLHEVSHNYNGLVFNGGIIANRWKHVNCGNPDGINSNYPYPTNQIGPVGPLNYYGYDPITRTVIAPNAAADYMSYCGPEWISDYNWRGLQDVLSIDPIDPAPAAPGDYIFVIGLIDDASLSAQVEQVVRIPAGSYPMAHMTKLLTEQTARTSANPALRVELYSGTGSFLRSVDVDPGEMSHEDSGTLRVFTALLQDDPPAASVSVVRRANNAAVGSRTASLNAPVVSAISSPVAGQTYNTTLPISWTASDADGDLLTYIVQYSRDSGVTWETLAANTPEPSVTIDATFLPGNVGSQTARIRVIASDGFNSGSLVSAAFNVPNRAPIVTINEPADGARFASGQSIRFRGTAMDPEFGILEGTSYSWFITGPLNTAVNTGPELLLPAGLPPGAYTVQAYVLDGQLFPGIDQISIFVGDTPAPTADADGDGVADAADNCAGLANANQADADSDGVGDACDNCPSVFNPDQGDNNANGIGNACDANILYVNHAATGANNGLSWANAFTSLESALAAADSIMTVEEIWIARGRYVPTARTNPNDARTATFRLRPGVSLRGGFFGNESSADDANPEVHLTTLSGDVNNNDGPSFTNRTDNVRTVLTSADGVDSTLIIDGLIISGGNGTGTPNPGGMNLFTTTPTIRRCDFVSNQGGTAGGAVLTGASQPVTFDRCRFLGNAASSGGAVGVTAGTPQFLSCVFTGNAATAGAGARGGAIAAFNASPALFNCTVAANTCTGLTGGVHVEGAANFSGTVVNSIAFFNTDSSGPTTAAQLRGHNGATLNVAYCCVQGDFPGQNIEDDPAFADLNGQDNITGTRDDQPRPTAGSPVNDAGANPYATGMAFDADGNPRFVDDFARIDTGVGPAPIVDMGAYERTEGTTCPADWNADGMVNSTDISAFLTSWLASVQAGDLAADFNGDGSTNSADISSFLTAWLVAVTQGC